MDIEREVVRLRRQVRLMGLGLCLALVVPLMMSAAQGLKRAAPLKEKDVSVSMLTAKHIKVKSIDVEYIHLVTSAGEEVGMLSAIKGRGTLELLGAPLKGKPGQSFEERLLENVVNRGRNGRVWLDGTGEVDLHAKDPAEGQHQLLIRSAKSDKVRVSVALGDLSKKDPGPTILVVDNRNRHRSTSVLAGLSTYLSLNRRGMEVRSTVDLKAELLPIRAERK